MNDQASTLRRMASTATIELESNETYQELDNKFKSAKAMRSIAITGGKGGVGKSNIAVNLAHELAALGNKVTLLDADLGLANADLLCGVSPKYHLGHAVSGDYSLDEIAINIGDGVTLIPGGSGIEELANLSFTSKPRLMKELKKIEQASDFMMIDTAAGIAQNVSGILTATSEIIVVTMPEPTALVDAYATIKVILRHSSTKRISLIVNNVTGIGDAEQAFQQLNATTEKFLSHHIEFLGAIPHDEQLVEAVREQIPVVKFAPSCPASRSIRLIAKNLQSRPHQDLSNTMQAQTFWEMLMQSES